MVLFNLKEVHISNLEEGTVLDKCPGGPPPLVHHLIRALDSTVIIIFESTACVFAVYRGVFLPLAFMSVGEIFFSSEFKWVTFYMISLHKNVFPVDKWTTCLLKTIKPQQWYAFFELIG